VDKAKGEVMPRIGERGWVHSGVKVVDNELTPTSWTDLDLSGVVGAQNTFVLLKLKNRNANAVNIRIRCNGDTDESSWLSVTGVNQCNLPAQNDTAYLVCETDEAGVIEWKEFFESAESIDVWVLGYIR